MSKHILTSDIPNTTGHFFFLYLACFAKLNADKKWALCTDPSPTVTKESGFVELQSSDSVLSLSKASAMEKPSALPTAGGTWDANVLVTTQSPLPVFVWFSECSLADPIAQ